jgi:hypothetical protein
VATSKFAERWQTFNIRPDLVPKADPTVIKREKYNASGLGTFLENII